MAPEVPSWRRARFAVGLLCGCLLPFLLGEFCVRLRPPEDLQPFLGDEIERAGIYQLDPVLRVAYRSAADFQPAEAPKLADIEPLNPPEPTWLFFGNSFARGLSASVRPRLPSHRVIFFRESKDELHLRVAQFRLALEHGLKPERAFFTLIPSEVATYAKFPLDRAHVNRLGALCKRHRDPGGPFGTLLDRSWLARMVWIRSRLNYADPTFAPSRITERIPLPTVDDFRKLFTALGQLSRQYQVPVTVVVLPERRQILGTSNYALQSTLLELAKTAGVDAFDPRAAFLAYSDKRAMYIPDWHYSPVGDGILLDALLAHLKQNTPSIAEGGPSR